MCVKRKRTIRRLGDREPFGKSGSVRIHVAKRLWPDRRLALPKEGFSSRRGSLLERRVAENPEIWLNAGIPWFLGNLVQLQRQAEVQACAGVFATTHWSVVLTAGDHESPHQLAALEKLCAAYWYPIYAFIRRRGSNPDEAKDRTQSFFEYLIERNAFAVANSERGKFRTFLLCSLNNFLANEWERGNRLKRGGGREIISLDSEPAEERYKLEPVDNQTPEVLFERRWAETLLQLVLTRLRAEYEAGSGSRRFEDVQTFIVEDRGAIPFAKVAEVLGMSEAALKSVVHRLRKRYRDLVREEIANTVSSPAEVEPELRHLLQALRS